MTNNRVKPIRIVSGPLAGAAVIAKWNNDGSLSVSGDFCKESIIVPSTSYPKYAASSTILNKPKKPVVVKK